MKRILPSLVALALTVGETTAFSSSIQPSFPISRNLAQSSSQLHASNKNNNNNNNNKNDTHTRPSRRTLLQTTLLTLTTTTTSNTIFHNSNSIANAAPIPNLPSVTLSEFETILKDSAKSILSVELSGPKSETALVKLVDGTEFSISDLVESSVDPRSPLKLVAKCRLYNIPVRNTALSNVLGGSGGGGLVGESGKKKKNYMNSRVQEAAEKERAKKERMEEDERERLAELYRLEGEEKGFLEQESR